MSNNLIPELEKFASISEAKAVLAAIEAKQRKKYFIKYWEPCNEDQWRGIHAFTADKKIVVIRGGNRSGKTDEGAAITTAFALGKEFFRDEPAWEWVKDLPIPEPPNNIWIVGLDFSVIKNVIWTEKLMKGQNHAAFVPDDTNLLEKANESDLQIRFTNGSQITCKSADSGRSKFQSASIDLVWIDEECDADIFDECYQRTSDCAGKLLVTLTPLTDVSSGIKVPWVFDLYEKRPPDCAFVSLSVMNNPHVPDAEKQKLKDKWTGHVEEEARLYGGFVQRSGLVYNIWDPKEHLVEPFQIDPSWYRIICVDPAATGTNAALFAAVEPRSNNLIFYREYYQADQILSEHAKGILMRTRGEPIDLWLIDPKAGAAREASTHKSVAALFKESGLPVRLAEVDQDYGMNASKEYLAATKTANPRHPKAYFFADLINFRWEIARYVWDAVARGPMKGMSKEKPRKRNDHLMNCYQYICAQRPRARQRYVPLLRQDLKEMVKYNSY